MTNVVDSCIIKGIMNGTQVREIRDRLKLSREKFARRLGVSFFTIWRWEKGKTKPSPMAEKLLKEINKDGG